MVDNTNENPIIWISLGFKFFLLFSLSYIIYSTVSQQPNSRKVIFFAEF